MIRLRIMTGNKDVVDALLPLTNSQKKLVMEKAILYYVRYLEGNISKMKKLDVIKEDGNECVTRSFYFVPENETVIKIIEDAIELGIKTRSLIINALVYYIGLLRTDSTIKDCHLLHIV